MSDEQRITAEKAHSIGLRLGIDWVNVDLEQFRRGLEVELEHGSRDPETDVTNDDLTLTGKIAWAHSKEIRDYYTRLDRLEAEAQAETIGLWPLRGGTPDPEGAAVSGGADLSGLSLAFSGAHGGLFSRLRHGSADLDEETRRGRSAARDPSGADLLSLMNEG